MKDLWCLQCWLKTCDEQSLWCGYRLHTKPNWIQKRKAADERRKFNRLSKKIIAMQERLHVLETEREATKHWWQPTKRILADAEEGTA